MNKYSELNAAIGTAILAGFKDNLPVIANQLLDIGKIETEQDLVRFDVRIGTVAKLLRLRRPGTMSKGKSMQALIMMAQKVREARFL